MLKNFCLCALVVMLLAACGTQNVDNNAADETVALTIAEFDANPDTYVGKTVAFTGTVDHVCRHGGKKMFLMGDTPEERIKVTATDDVVSFPVELEGSQVRVEGVLEEERIDAAYLDDMEVEACSAEKSLAAAKTEAAEGEVAEAAEEEMTEEQKAAEMEQIKSLRQQVAESEKGYLSFYSLACKSYEESH